MFASEEVSCLTLWGSPSISTVRPFLISDVSMATANEVVDADVVELTPESERGWGANPNAVGTAKRTSPARIGSNLCNILEDLSCSRLVEAFSLAFL